MSVVTSDQPTNYDQITGAVQVRIKTLKASANIPKGTLAVNDGGKANAYTSALFTGGAPVLGVALFEGYYESSGADVTSEDPQFLFHKGCIWVADLQSGDEPTVLHIGRRVTVVDHYTVRQTPTTGTYSVVLLGFTKDGQAICFVPVLDSPNP